MRTSRSLGTRDADGAASHGATTPAGATTSRIDVCPSGPTSGELADYLRIEERELEAGGPN